MKHMLKNLKFMMISILLIGFSACSLSPEKTSNISTNNPEFSNIKRIDPIPQTLSLFKEERYAEASDYLEYFLDMDYVKNDFDANRLFETIKAKRSEWKYLASKTTYGCLDGKSDEYSGLAAATICDFFVIGDFRDLGEQGKKYLNDQEVDKMTLTLASLGIGAAGATAFTWGTSATIKPPISLLKISNKIGKTPKWIPSYLEGLAENPKSNRSAKEFALFLYDLWKLQQAAGYKSAIDLLSKSKNIEDFQKLAKFGENFGSKSSTLLNLGGDDVIQLILDNKNIPKQLYIEASSFGESGIKALDKSGKRKFQSFITSENMARRRMTNFELELIDSGKKYTVLGNEFIKRDYLFNSQFLDGAGKSNIERMKMGLAPIGLDGNPINLHHMKQQKNGVLVEMSTLEHRNHSGLLHRYSRVSEIDREEFNLLKNAYWKMRAKDFN
jgi:hypothetical protein